MDVSIGIIAHNEEKNISQLLDAFNKQILNKVQIKEIIVVISGKDKTAKIAQAKGTIVLRQEQRTGKALAINEFFKKAKGKILVLSSADIIPDPNAIENLCKPLSNSKVGIVSSNPKPLAEESMLNQIVRFQWKLQRNLSFIKPKFGELIAFKNVLDKIENTAADEEYIAMMIMKQGFEGKFASDAKLTNKGPNTLSDFIIQRRRIHCGHLSLAKEGYRPISLNYNLVLHEAINILQPNNIHIFVLASMMEAIGRFLGTIDYYSGKEHHIWCIAKSTKTLN